MAVRTPQQQRAKEKKSKIIRAGYELFATDGFYNTNTAQIAKRAGVSTGIVYGYFHDKRDILLAVLDMYIEHAYQPVFAVLDKFVAPIDYATLIPEVLDAAVESHRQNAAMHESLHALTHTDEVVAGKFMALEEVVTHRMVELLTRAGCTRQDLSERVHWAMQSVQSFAHECVFDRHPYIDYEAMRRLVEQILIALFCQPEGEV